LFKPGVLQGHETQFVQFKRGDQAYATDYKDFAPSLGFAWNPTTSMPWLRRLIGEKDQTIVRGGFSLSYTRNGLSDFSNVYGANTGSFVSATRSTALGNLVQGSEALPVLLRESNRLSPPSFPATPAYPITGAITDSVNIFDPKLKVPYAESWSFGVQREISKNMAIEVRYVGTRYSRPWTQYNLNEVNIVENGFLNEFKLAEANLQANIAAGRGATFRYSGANTGTAPLPITLGYFNAVPTTQAGDETKYTSANFTNTTFVNTLVTNNPVPYTFASNLYGNAGLRDNASRAGIPANLFLVNPGLQGGAFYTGNGGSTRYDSMVLEFRRRLSGGLLMEANYTLAKSFDSTVVSLRAPLSKNIGSSLANVFKMNWVYQLPLGSGKRFGTGAGPTLDRLIGGWEFHGAGRVQSGQWLNFGNVKVVGMTTKDLQDVFKLCFDDANKRIYSLPQDIIDNTIRAFGGSATSPSGYGSLGAPTGRYLAPPSDAGCIQVVRGDCAPQNVNVMGPRFVRYDLSITKKVKLSERTDFELRGELLDAFNNVNFFGNTNMTNFNSATFAQVTSAYRDQSNTQDPGGRLVQIVARITW
jgi:hypothetical protein